ncbi:MAG: DUF4900 domain-containing protein [bacterium]
MKQKTRGLRQSTAGYALAGAIIVLFVMGIVGTAFLVMAGYEVRATEAQTDSQRAFWLAEAGKERAIDWMTRQSTPPGSDRSIYANQTGPNGGTYSVQVLVDTTLNFAAEKAFLIESVGEYQGHERRIRQRIRMTSFATYAYFTNDEIGVGGQIIWFATGNVVEGRLHSNGRLHILGSPVFLGEVTSASDRMIGSPNYNVYDADGWPVGSNNPTFAEGFRLNSDVIPLPESTGDLRAAAQGGGRFLAGGHTIEVGYTGNQPAGTPRLGWLRYQPNGGGAWDSLEIAALDPRVVYVDGDANVWGVLDGELTISSSSDITLIDDLTYAASDAAATPLPGCNDMMGLVAEDNIIFNYDVPRTDNLKVNAVLMALNTSITAEQYNNGVLRGSLTIWGGLIQERRGAVGLAGGAGGGITSGYQKDYHYDPRVTGRKPPEFPLTGVYEEVRWDETWDTSNPF